MKTRAIILMPILVVVFAGCAEKPAEPTVEAPPSKEGAVQNLEAPLLDQGAATKGRG